MLNSEISGGIGRDTFIGIVREWMGRPGRVGQGRVTVFAKGSSRRSTEPIGAVSPGGVERRIVAEVAVQLRISPRFSDDGKAEGYCERPLSIHVDGESEEEESEDELELNEEFNRKVPDARGR